MLMTKANLKANPIIGINIEVLISNKSITAEVSIIYLLFALF